MTLLVRATSAAVFPPFAPTAMEAPTVAPASGQLLVGFVPPASDGGSPGLSYGVRRSLTGAGSWRYAAVPGGDDGACNLQLALLGSRISDERDDVSSLSSCHKRIQDVLAHVAIKRLMAG